jgi:hypothetical protein
VTDFIKAGSLVVPVAAIEAVDLSELERGRVEVTYGGGKRAVARGVDAYELVMLLRPSAVEGRRLRFARHAWAVHNLVAHPVMQVLAWLGLPRLAIRIHDRTIPRPISPRVSGRGC